MINNYFKKILISTRSKSDEGGAMFVMAFLSILMFLFFTILMLDVPYLERVGRSMQRTIDTASLAGTVQLTSRLATDNLGNPNFPVRQTGWLRAKRAVFFFLRMNPIAGVESLNFTPTGFTGSLDPLENLNNAYGYENYSLTSGSIQADLRISRGVYERPFVINPNVPTFYRTERDDIANSDYWNIGINIDPIQSVECVTQLNLPSACLTLNTALVSVADSVQISLTINNIPTLFGKLLGISTTSLTRTSLSVPQ